MPRLDSLSQIQRQPPFGRLTARAVHALALDKVRPMIRIAHRIRGPVRIAERIIFDHELVLFMAGQGTAWFAGGEPPIAFGPHDLFCIPPFVPHGILSAPGQFCEHLAVHFDWAPGVPPAGNLPGRKPYEVRLPGGLALPRRIRLVARDRFSTELAQLVELSATGQPLDELVASGCLLHVLAGLLQRAGKPRPSGSARDPARIESALAMLGGNLTAPCVPSDLARAAGLSLSHFNRLFREWTGFAPVAYQRRQRVARARELLADPRLSIKQIAAQCGFDDPYHFSRLFRQIDGLSPSHYRQARLAGQGVAERP